MKCDICGSVETYVKEHEHSYNIKGQNVVFSSKRRFCSNCNNLVYDEVLDNNASLIAIDLYNKQYGIDKEKIVNLRKMYGLSQTLFSKLIGCAKKTLISYEKGTSIPNDSYAIILRSLLANPELIEDYLVASKQSFTEKEYNKTNDLIEKFLVNNTKQLVLDGAFSPSEFNGYTKLNRNKIYNIIQFFAGQGVCKTKLLKELFYADFLFYKDNCKSITGLEYVKYQYGPVPEDFENILSYGVIENIINYDYKLINNYENHVISGKKMFDKKVFTDNELEILNKVKDKFEDYNVGEIVEYSHKEKAFIDTEYYNKISYDKAFDIEIV